MVELQMLVILERWLSPQVTTLGEHLSVFESWKHLWFLVGPIPVNPWLQTCTQRKIKYHTYSGDWLPACCGVPWG